MSDELDYRWRKVSEWGQPEVGAMTNRTITIPPVTATLLAHGVTDWSTHDYRGSVEVGDRGIIVAGKGPVRSERIGEYVVDGRPRPCDRDVPPRLMKWEGDRLALHVPVHSRAAVAVGTVAEVVPIARCSGKRHICNQPGDALLDHSPLHEPHADGETEHDISYLLPFADWSPTTASGRQRWAVRWEEMRVLDEAVTRHPDVPLPTNRPIVPFSVPVPLHRGWRVADAGLIEACREASDGA